MFQIMRQPEPSDFDEKIRTPGQAFLQSKGIYSGPVPKNFSWKALWTECADDLYKAYSGISAYSGLHFFHKTTGARTVEHFLPKKNHPLEAYEWRNYRLVSARLNGRKSDYEDVFDPFELPQNCYFMNFLDGTIYINSTLASEHKNLAQNTIIRLKLNDPDICSDRILSYEDYCNRNLTAAGFKKYSPFVYLEAIRQNLLRPEDRP